MPEAGRCVFLLDVDNTLLDNDSLIEELMQYLEREFGAERRRSYQAIFETLRGELGYADYLGALQRFRLSDDDDPRILQVSSFLVDYPFATRLYPDARAVVERLGELGTTVILSDGDVVFQPRKIQRSGLWDAVAGRVLIYVHKEERVAEIMRHYPAEHYVMIDDKVRLLAAMKAQLKERLTTVFARQGHYAHDAAEVARYPAADHSIGRIGELLAGDLAWLWPGAG